MSEFKNWSVSIEKLAIMKERRNKKYVQACTLLCSINVHRSRYFCFPIMCGNCSKCLQIYWPAGPTYMVISFHCWFTTPKTHTQWAKKLYLEMFIISIPIREEIRQNISLSWKYHSNAQIIVTRITWAVSWSSKLSPQLLVQGLGKIKD